jgi:SAM-dependent methyltransferase
VSPILDQLRRLRQAREHCPCCDHDVRLKQFRGRRNAQCPDCGALERHRALAGYLADHLSAETRVLHFAPEPFLVPLFLRRTSHYVAADLFPEATNVARNVEVVKADIMDLPFPDESFDVAVVSHVLEHVEDDKQALHEVRRTLRVGGTLVAQHPWFPDMERTVADPGETDPDERLRRFGQADHVRKYGRDYFDMLRSSGFEVEVLPSSLPPGNHVAVCTRV